ncbi:MAG: IS3 family transposase [Acetobacteraceae bacterium]
MQKRRLCCWRSQSDESALSDADLLIAIRADLARSRWHGEGYRKVWARLRVLNGIRVSRTRVLQLMRETHLLSPHRRSTRAAHEHAGRIVTDAPNVMWSTDATLTDAVRDEKFWLFGVAGHWETEALDWNVSKRGDRCAAAGSIAVAVKRIFGHRSASAARGVALRHDRGGA